MITQTRNLLHRRPEIVIWLIFGYFVLSVVLRILRSETLQNDEAEQVFQAQFLLLGYGRQPPLYNWLQDGLFHFLGLSVATLSLLKNLLLFLTCLFCGLAVRIVADDRRLSLVAMLGVLAIPSVSVLAQRDLTHAVSTFCMVALFLCALFRALKEQPSLANYLLVGVTVGVGILTKYNFVIVPVAAILAMLADKEFRMRLVDWRVAPAIAVAFAICLPHMIWALTHLDAATSGTIQAMREGATGDVARDRVRGLMSIVVSAAKTVAPILAIFLIGFWGQMRAILAAESRWTRLSGLTIAASLAIVCLIAVLFDASNIRQKWLAPFILMIPIYICLKIDAAHIDTRRAVARMAPPVIAVIVGFVIIVAIGNLVTPMMGKYGKEQSPYGPFLSSIISEHGQTPAYVITDDLILAGNARLQLKTVPVVMPDFQPPVSLERATISGPGLLVWPIESQEVGIPDDIRYLLGKHGVSVDNVAPNVLDVPYLNSGGRASMRFGYAWLTPRT